MEEQEEEGEGERESNAASEYAPPSPLGDYIKKGVRPVAE